MFTLKCTPTIQLQTISRDELFKSYQLLDVRSYCKECTDHNTNYSCPPHAPTGENYIPPKSNIVLILTLIDTSILDKNYTELAKKSFYSSTFEKYKNLDAQISKYTEISMYAFDTLRTQLSLSLLKLESKINATSIPAGKCVLCTPCQKSLQEQCAFPEKIRYSLESLGFLVSPLMKDYFNHELTFQKDKFPPYFATLSALISTENINHNIIKRELSHIDIVF